MGIQYRTGRTLMEETDDDSRPRFRRSGESPGGGRRGERRREEGGGREFQVERAQKRLIEGLKAVSRSSLSPAAATIEGEREMGTMVGGAGGARVGLDALLFGGLFLTVTCSRWYFR